MKKIATGIYPTMITPYKDGEIDYDAVRRLVNWYIKTGCTGIFAVCQSSEMMYLSIEEKVTLAKTVVEEANGRISIVASGHCADSFDAQVEEINAVSGTGIDAFVLITNRFDPHNDGDDVWIENAQRLLKKINPDIPLGLYECPKPYKRLLTPEILKWCLETKRFQFIKDTCCDPDMLKERLDILKGSDIMLFNANEQTYLYSLKNGAAGYSGIMANIHPDLLVWLQNNFRTQPDECEMLSNILSMSAFTESPAYPCTAKYYLGKEGITMDTYSRSSDKKLLTSYQKLVFDQLYELNNELRKSITAKALLPTDNF